MEHGILIFVHLILHPRILKGEHTKLEIVRLPDDHILDGLEFLLLRQWFVFSRRVFVVPLQLIPQPVPVFIALRHLRELGQLIHDHMAFCYML